MKNYFKIGLMALTLAFGVTSCDKQDNGGSAVNALSLEAQGLASKVTFGETGGMAAPKGFKNLTAKNAADFANSHIYATTSQVLTIYNNAGVQYTGSYTAGDISSLDPSEILLANGDYTATSSNADNDGLGLVSGFAPYTSTIDFNLSAAATIQLAVTHERGFVIADSEDAIGGSRITSVELSQGTGELQVSGNLILDASDGLNDFYGYLEAGDYDVVINYMLNNSPSSVTGSVVIANGVASTLAPMLDEEAPVVVVTTDVQSAVVTSTEAAIRGGDGLDVNEDGDTLDGVTRTVTTTTILHDGVAVPSTDAVPNPTLSESPWVVLAAQNINRVSTDEDPSLGDSSTASDTAEFVDAEYSAYGPAFVAQLDDFTQTREVSNSDANLDPDATLEALTRIIAVTNEVTLDAEIGVEGVTTYSATIDGEVETHDVAIDALDAPIVARTYSDWDPAFGTQIANFDQARTVTNEGNFGDVAVEALARNIAVTSSITTEATVGAAGVRTYSATIDGLLVSHEVAIDALEDTSAPDALPAAWLFDGTSDFINADAVGYSWSLQAPIAGNFAGKYLAQFTINGTQQTLEEAQVYAAANGGDSFTTTPDQSAEFIAWANAQIAFEFNNQ